MTRFFRFRCVAGVPIVVSACAAPAPPPTAAPAPIERGKYIVDTAGCHDCHTPAKMGPNGPEPDMARALSGHPESIKVDGPAKLPNGWMAAVNPTFTAWSGPWGVSFTANLTPDPSGPILPPMPWPVYRNLTDDDLKAVFAYLKSIPPVSNHVPDPIVIEPTTP